MQKGGGGGGARICRTLRYISEKIHRSVTLTQIILCHKVRTVLAGHYGTILYSRLFVRSSFLAKWLGERVRVRVGVGVRVGVRAREWTHFFFSCLFLVLGSLMKGVHGF